ncbi:MAG: hypothetical protein HC773_05175 [Scytonema sp. CRU_2_7]|nr:hypothetical protein [Scytonema sp. CRU_2_7]
MATSILFGRVGGKIGALQLDATLSEDHAYQNEVSQFPVENGDTIVDNIRKLPEQITINGLVTNSPVNVTFTDITNIVDGVSNKQESRTIERDDTPTRVETAQNILLRISGRVIHGNQVQPEIVDIVTGLRVYKNMAMTSLKINRTGATGQALNFTADFLQVKSVIVKLIAPQPNFKAKATPKIPKGKQKPATPATVNSKLESRTSIAKNAFNSAQKLLTSLGG